MSDNETSASSLEFSFNYGKPGNIEHDVGIFERFYGSVFRNEACERFAARVKRQCSLFIGIGIVMAISCLIPLAVNVQSVFAYVLLAIGLVPLAVTLFYLHRFITARQYCEKNLERLLDGQFALSRTESRRIFNISFYDTHVEMASRTASKAEQARKRNYDDIEACYETDDLFFIEGMTWLAKFQMDESTVTCIEQVLRKKLNDRYACIGNE